ncbi:MAG TPA: site-specific tyrosine recombinase XerD [Candidatus Sphingobacterium stercorigallinarum]|nr:site-specific tyrosine recombinase XerD [Candidatus Sphingobacterium stercorigallinarum]
MDWDILKKDFKRYLLLERGLSENSIAAYLNDLNKLQQFAEIKKLNAADIRTQDLQEFLQWINEFAISAFSQARLLSGIKTFYTFMTIERHVATSPADLLETPRLARKIPAVLAYHEIDELIGANDLSTPEGVRNKAILEVLYGCGLRVSELCSLKISNLFLEVEFIKVEGKGNKERLVPIGKQAIHHLRIYLDEIRTAVKIKPGKEDYVFLNRRGNPLSRVMVFLIIKELAKRIDLKKEISPHTFRHSFASHLVEGGADLRAVQDMLGHESITTTEIYTHIDREYLHSVINQFHPRS